MPLGCEPRRNGLVLPDNLEYDAWMAVGHQVVEAAGAVLWLLGDWLAYGQSHYLDSHWGKRVPDGLYARISQELGIAEQTLTNAKYVCLRLPISRRREKLTFSHALEIVSQAPEGQHEFWIDKTVREGISVKELREQLRRSRSSVRLEPHDTGTKSFLEGARQFARDYNASIPTLTPALRVELRKILGGVVRDLS